MLRGAEQYVRRDGCPWRTALALLRVTEAEDERWRDEAEAAEERGELDLAAPLGVWLDLHRTALGRIARAAGALQRTARGRAKPGAASQVAAARELLKVEAVDAWGQRAEAEAPAEVARASLDLDLLDAADDQERAEVARLTEVVRNARSDLEVIVRRLRTRLARST